MDEASTTEKRQPPDEAKQLILNLEALHGALQDMLTVAKGMLGAGQSLIPIEGMIFTEDKIAACEDKIFATEEALHMLYLEGLAPTFAAIKQAGESVPTKGYILNDKPGFRNAADRYTKTDIYRKVEEWLAKVPKTRRLEEVELDNLAVDLLLL